MPTVTALTAARSLEIEDGLIVGAAIVANDLVLTKHDDTEITVPLSTYVNTLVNAGITALKAGAGPAYDTLLELQNILINDETAVSALTTVVGTKVPLSLFDAAGDLLVGSGDNTAAKLSKGAALQLLRVNAAATALEWVDPTASVPLSVFDASGDILVGSGDNAASRLAKGTALQVLRVNAAGTALEWAAPATTGIAPTLVDAAGDLLVGTADDTVDRLAKGTALQVLRVKADASTLEWADPAGGGSVSARYWNGSAYVDDTDVRLFIGPSTRDPKTSTGGRDAVNDVWIDTDVETPPVSAFVYNPATNAYEADTDLRIHIGPSTKNPKTTTGGRDQANDIWIDDAGSGAAEWVKVFEPTSLASFTGSSGTWTEPSPGQWQGVTNGGYLYWDFPIGADPGTEVFVTGEVEYTVSPGVIRMMQIFRKGLAAPTTNDHYAGVRPDGYLVVEKRNIAGIEAISGNALTISTWYPFVFHSNEATMALTINGSTVRAGLAPSGTSLRRIIFFINDGGTGTVLFRNLKIFARRPNVPT